MRVAVAVCCLVGSAGRLGIFVQGVARILWVVTAALAVSVVSAVAVVGWVGSAGRLDAGPSPG